jgi:hypothetical protein
MRRYGIIVGLEFGIAAWVCLVVGVHVWPMAPVLQARPWWRCER